QGASNQLFIRKRPIHISGVKHGDATFDSEIYCRTVFGISAARIKFRHTHAAEREARRRQPMRSQPRNANHGWPRASHCSDRRPLLVRRGERTTTAQITMQQLSSL